MTDLREELLPQVLDLKTSQLKVLEDNDDMRLCIAAFDEALLTKANKSSLVTLEESIRVSFVKQFDWRELRDSLVANDERRTDEQAKLVSDNKAF